MTPNARPDRIAAQFSPVGEFAAFVFASIAGAKDPSLPLPRLLSDVPMDGAA